MRNVSGCRPCLKGYYDHDRKPHTYCIKCPSMATSTVGALKCSLCGGNTRTPRVCDAGKMSPAKFDIAVKQRRCNVCQACNPGKYRDENSPEECKDCPRGKYIPYPPKTHAVCSKCPLHQEPTDGKTRCKCNAGFYNATARSFRCFTSANIQFEPWALAALTEDTVCQPCPTNTAGDRCADCDGGTLRLRAGYAVSEAENARQATDPDYAGSRKTGSRPVGVFPCLEEERCAQFEAVATVSQNCTAGYGGPLCDNCATGHARSGLKGKCMPCENKSSTLGIIVAVVGVLMVAALVFLYLKRSTMVSGGGHEVNCVLSFGSRQGGAKFAADVQTRIMESLGWTDENIYLDIGALAGKAGTEKVAMERDGETATANLNPSWAAYYRAAMEESPSMCFMLSEQWCKSQWCQDELLWYLTMRAGCDLSDTSPAALSKAVMGLPKEKLLVMREGAFFIMTDEYSKTSDVYQMLTETNLAFPENQFFEMDLSCIDDEHEGFVSHMNRYLYEVRFSEQYAKAKAEFGDLAKLSMSLVANFMTVAQMANDMRSLVLAPLKSAMSSCQILVGMEFSLSIQWPSIMKKVVNSVKFLTLDLFGALSTGCMLGDFAFHDKLLITNVTPVLLLAVTLAVYFLYLCTAGEQTPATALRIRNHAIKAALLIMFLVYPLWSQTIFQCFNCMRLDTNEYWLIADLQIACDADGISPLALPGAILVVLVPIGVPAATLLLLWMNRDQLMEFGTPSRDTFAFLVDDYKPEYYYYEVVEMARKVILVGLLIFIDRGSALQLVVSIIVVLFFLVWSAHLSPNVKIFQNNFKVAVDMALLVNLVLAMLMKIDLRDENISALGVGVLMLLSLLGLPLAVVAWEVAHGRVGDNEGKSLTSSEKAKAIALFKTLDSNANGKLSHDEVVTFVLSTRPDWLGEGEGQGHKSNLQNATAALLETLDTDGNGTVTRSEWFSYLELHYKSRAERSALFAIVDAHITFAALALKRQTLELDVVADLEAPGAGEMSNPMHDDSGNPESIDSDDDAE